MFDVLHKVIPCWSLAVHTRYITAYSVYPQTWSDFKLTELVQITAQVYKDRSEFIEE